MKRRRFVTNETRNNFKVILLFLTKSCLRRHVITYARLPTRSRHEHLSRSSLMTDHDGVRSFSNLFGLASGTLSLHADIIILGSFTPLPFYTGYITCNITTDYYLHGSQSRHGQALGREHILVHTPSLCPGWPPTFPYLPKNQDQVSSRARTKLSKVVIWMEGLIFM